MGEFFSSMLPDENFFFFQKFICFDILFSVPQPIKIIQNNHSNEIFSLVISGPNKKSSANSGLHKIIFLIKTIPAITITKFPLQKPFLPLREYSLLMIKLVLIVLNYFNSRIFILFLIIALRSNGVDISTRYANAPGPR